MRVLIVSQYFWPEGFRINELVQSLVARGVVVDVLTGKPNYPEGKIYPGYRAAGTMDEFWQGAHIFRVPLFPRGLRSSVRLFLNYISFMFSAGIVGGWKLRTTKSDIVFVYAPSPLLQALPALFIGWLKRVPVVVYVQDLWPESLSATGYIQNRFVIGIVESLVKFIYRFSDLILVSSRPFRECIQRFSPAAEIVYYPNSVDASFCKPEHGLKVHVPALDSGFCVIFAGNLGAAQAVHVIVEAAALLRENADIRVVVFGSGSRCEWIREQIAERQLNNLFLAGRFPGEAMPYLLSRASALLVTLADQEILAATVPNKIQAYMAVGRPIIASMNGEGARLVVEANAGLAVPAEDSKALADAILELRALPKEARENMGSNARDYYRNHFDHEKLVSELIERLTDVIKVKI
jgi:glycosyltransferase involved in cell wall biosynthesis